MRKHVFMRQMFYHLPSAAPSSSSNTESWIIAVTAAKTCALKTMIVLAEELTHILKVAIFCVSLTDCVNW